MARFLAIDWDASECRYLLASVQKESVIVRAAGAVAIELPPSTEENASASPFAELDLLTSTLQKLIKEEHLDPCPTLLSLGRSDVEMIYQTLPPSSDAEIPVLLKNQVLRELSGFTDFDPLDYIVLSGEDGEQVRLLAMTIPLSYRQALVRRFRAIGRAPRQITFRAVAAARSVLDQHRNSEEREPEIVVNAVGNDVDLVLLDQGRIVSIRSFRLPEQFRFEESVRRIVEEIDRTVTVGVEGMSDLPIRKVSLFGQESDWGSLIEMLAERKLETVVVCPFSLPEISISKVPEQSGRFAPLVGMLLGELPQWKAESRSGIDFLHTKDAPKPTNYIRSIALFFFLFLIAGFGLYRWNQGVVQGMEEKLAALKKEYAETSRIYQQVQPIWTVLSQTVAWDAQGVVWLDEFREMSAALPGEQDLVVSQISFTTGPVGNDPRFPASGTIQMSGMVRDPAVLYTFQKTLNSTGKYMMRNPTTGANPAGGGYPWNFRTSIVRLRR